MSETTKQDSLFLRVAAYDFVLCLVASVALVFTISFAFESAPDLRSNVFLEACISAVLLAIMFAGTRSKRAIAPAVVATGIVAVAVIAVFAIVSGSAIFADGGVSDSAGNLAVFGAVCAVVPIVVFLLSRRRVLCLILFAATIVACGFVQFLFRDFVGENNGLIAVLVCLFAEFGLYVYRNYHNAVLRADTALHPAFGRAFAFSSVVSLACLAVGAVVFFGLVAPLGIATPHIKPFKDYYYPPTVEYTGIYDSQDLPDPDKKSDQLTDETQQTSSNAEADKNQDVPDNANIFSGTPIGDMAESLNAFDSDGWAERFQNIAYDLTSPTGVVLMLLALAAIVGVIAAWRYRRVLRLHRMKDLPPGERTLAIVTFLTQRFSRIGFSKPESMTPLDWVFSVRSEMVPFTRGTQGVDMVKLTLLAQRVRFGGEQLAEGDYKLAERYYFAFFDNARRYLGYPKWFVFFWRL